MSARFLRFATVLMCIGISCKADRTRPEVEWTYPAFGDTAVPTNAALQVTFSELMDHATAEQAFQLTPTAAGTFTWQNLGLAFRPDSNLAGRTQYRFVLGTGAQDPTGNPLASETDVLFTTGDSAVDFVTFRMMGRSVMHNWFAHWDSNPYVPYFRGRFVLNYCELLAPPDMESRVEAIVDSILVGEAPVVFFKFCFEDFIGGDSAGAAERLDRNKGIVQHVYNKVVGSRGLRLIVGNALPQVSGATDQWLVWSHRQYNGWLAQFEQQHANVKVFDLYGVLSDSAGNLKAEYQTSNEDSHPNEAGYLALDGPFFTLCEVNYP